MVHETRRPEERRPSSSFIFVYIFQNAYEKSIKEIATFDSVERFWQVYSNLEDITDVPFSADYHLFRTGIKPMWEDAKNKSGGKLSFRMKRKDIPVLRFWESLLLGLIGESLDPGLEEICGVIASVRARDIVLSVWTRQANDADVIAEIKDRMKTILQLPGFVKVNFKKHLNS